MGDWLGTGRIAASKMTYRSFEQARAFAISLGLKSTTEWNKYCREGIPGKPPKPDDIPAAPWNSYTASDWLSIADWLGYETRKHEPRSFNDAREYVRKLGLSSIAEWHKYCSGLLPHLGKKPNDIPTNPHRSYDGLGWINMGDWLGTNRQATRNVQFLDFETARSIVRKLCIKNSNDWRKLCKGNLIGFAKLPKNIPTNPDRTYNNKGWINWTDWFTDEKK